MAHQNNQMQKEQKFRAFFALDLSDEIKRDISRLIDTLREQYGNKGISWTRVEKLHITLAFLGDITNLQCSNILKAVKAIISRRKKFTIKFAKLKLFPSKKNPRVISIMPLSEPLMNLLANEIAKIVTNYGVKLESRAFKPHLTIARINKYLEPFIKEITIPAMSFQAEQVILYRSDFTDRGSVYTPLEKIELGS